MVYQFSIKPQNEIRRYYNQNIVFKT